MSICKLCKERGKPAHFGCDPRCAFEGGEFSSGNWNCATANAIRELMDDGEWRQECREDGNDSNFCICRNDQSYGVLFVPPHPDDVPEGKSVGPWRGGGLIAGYWYKRRGQTEMLIRVDPRNGGREEDAAKRLTLEEAEAAIENWKLKGRITGRDFSCSAAWRGRNMRD